MSEGQVVGAPTVDQMAERIAANLQKMAEDEDFAHELREGHTSGNPMTLGPRLPTTEEWAELQVKGSEDNSKKWLQRTLKPKKNFKEEALRPTAVEKYKTRMREVIEEDRHKGGMELVDIDETMRIIEAGGEEAYKAGVRKRKDKIKKRVGELREARLALCAEIDDMDVATDADREQKMLANVRGLKAIGKARRGA